jgi:uncharacterized protein (DUF302 family)
LITIASPHSVRETIDRLAAAGESAGLITFLRVDHAAGAASVGMNLRPTELLVFGHPRGGTPLMQANQSAGIDLPVRALAWEDEAGQVWLGYNDADWLARRHQLGRDSEDAVAAIRDGLAKLARIATS